MRIKNIKIREILATNAKKTLEAEIETFKGKVRASVPIGTSRGRYEAKYLPTDQAIRKFLMIKRYFTSEDFSDMEAVDTLLRSIDNTSDFRDIGGNVALAVSSAFLKALALDEGKEVYEYVWELTKQKDKPIMPKPISNVLGGWYNSDIQEYLLLPIHQISFKDSIEKISAAYLEIAEVLKQKDKNFLFSRNLESGWVSTSNFEDILNILTSISKKHLLKIGLDMAASHLWDGNNYAYKQSGLRLSKINQISFIEDLMKRYSILYVEDPFHEDDYVSFGALNLRMDGRIICGDDLYVTNIDRLRYGIESKSSNAILIKPNQVCTITDVIKTVEEAKKNKMITIFSHRSSDTEDTINSHLAVGLGSEYVKFGLAGERTNKINELIRIEENLK